MESCKLSSCPPVGETMHFAGICYCHLCTCSKHSCPNKDKENKYSPSTLSSIYQKDFQKKTAMRLQPFLPFSPKITHKKQELVSTSQADFTYTPTTKTPSAKYDKNPNIGMIKQALTSCYRSNYPNWRYYEFVNLSKFKESTIFRNNNCSPTTTYSDSYKQFKIEKARSEKRLQNRSPIPTGDFSGSTVNKDHFKEIHREDFAKRANIFQPEILHLESPKQAYSTFYKREFNREL